MAVIYMQSMLREIGLLTMTCTKYVGPVNIFKI